MTKKILRSSPGPKVATKANLTETKSPARKANFVVASPIRTPKKAPRKNTAANSAENSPIRKIKDSNSIAKESVSTNPSSLNSIPSSPNSKHLKGQESNINFQTPTNSDQPEILMPEKITISSELHKKEISNESAASLENESLESESDNESIPDEEIDSESSEDELKLNELFAQARKTAMSSDFSLEQKKTTPFILNGKFFDPYSEAVQNHLYIQNVSEYTRSDDKVPILRPVKLNSSLLGLKVDDSIESVSLQPKTIGHSTFATSVSKTSQPVEHEIDLVNSNLTHALNTNQSRGLEKLCMQRELPKYPRTKAELAKDKASNAGPSWFNMPSPDMTPELKRDLELLSLRNVLDRKRFYKKSDKVAPSKFLQVGTIVEDKSEFFSSRIARRDRQSTIVGEVLHDAETQSYLTSKYAELQASSIKNGRRKNTNDGYFKKSKKSRRK